MNANDFTPEFLTQQKTARAEPSAADQSLLLKNEVYQIVGCAMEVLGAWERIVLSNHE